MRLGINLNLVHNRSRIESMSVNPLGHYRPISVHPYFKYSLSRIKAIHWAIWMMCQCWIQPYICPGRNSCPMTVARMSVVQTVYVNCIAEDVCCYVTITDRWHELVVCWEATIIRIFVKIIWNTTQIGAIVGIKNCLLRVGKNCSILYLSFRHLTLSIGLVDESYKPKLEFSFLIVVSKC